MTAVTMPPDDLISPSKAARMLSVHLCSVYRWLMAGKLRGWRLGKNYRVSESDVRALLVPVAITPARPTRQRSTGIDRARHRQAERELRNAGFRF